jgi:hypothetical protein
VDWLSRVRGRPPPSGPEPDENVPEAIETMAPGVTALFDGMVADGTHAILDLGAASAASLSVYGRFARQIRFADLPGRATLPRGPGLIAALLDAVPPQPARPYDIVFAWDVLDRLYPECHAPLVARLAEVAAPDARLHILARGSERVVVRPLRFMLIDTDRMRYEPSGPAGPVMSQLLPAQLAHLLEPFRVVRGFTLKGDLREYVALREGE